MFKCHLLIIILSLSWLIYIRSNIASIIKSITISYPPNNSILNNKLEVIIDVFLIGDFIIIKEYLAIFHELEVFIILNDEEYIFQSHEAIELNLNYAGIYTLQSSVCHNNICHKSGIIHFYSTGLELDYPKYRMFASLPTTALIPGLTSIIAVSSMLIYPLDPDNVSIEIAYPFTPIYNGTGYAVCIVYNRSMNLPDVRTSLQVSDVDTYLDTCFLPQQAPFVITVGRLPHHATLSALFIDTLTKQYMYRIDYIIQFPLASYITIDNSSISSVTLTSNGDALYSKHTTTTTNITTITTTTITHESTSELDYTLFKSNDMLYAIYDAQQDYNIASSGLNLMHALAAYSSDHRMHIEILVLNPIFMPDKTDTILGFSRGLFDLFSWVDMVESGQISSMISDRRGENECKRAICRPKLIYIDCYKHTTSITRKRSYDLLLQYIIQTADYIVSLDAHIASVYADDLDGDSFRAAKLHMTHGSGGGGASQELTSLQLMQRLSTAICTPSSTLLTSNNNNKHTHTQSVKRPVIVQYIDSLLRVEPPFGYHIDLFWVRG